MVAYQILRKSSEKLHPLKNGFQLKLQFFCKIFFPPESDPNFFDPAEKCTDADADAEIFRFGGQFGFAESKIDGRQKIYRL